MGRFVTKKEERTVSERRSLNEHKLDLRDSNIDLDTYNAISELLLSHSVYISTYIQLLNKYINLIKRVSTLKNERNLLIKFVKKLRFFNNYYYFKELIYVPETINKNEFKILESTFSEVSSNLQELQAEKDLIQKIAIEALDEEGFQSGASVGSILTRIVTSNCKLLEVIEILNFLLTNFLKNEINSKTLNEKLVLSEEINKTMSHVYCIFIKFNQWIIEALKLDNINGNLDIELLEMVIKNDVNSNINIQLSEDDALLLQEVDECVDVSEFSTIVWQWCDVIRSLLKNFDEEIENVLNINSNNINASHSTSTNISLANTVTKEECPVYDEPQQEVLKKLNVPKRNNNSNNTRNSRNQRQSSSNSRASSANSSFY